MLIRRMRPEDVSRVVVIAGASPEAAHWPQATYSSILGNPTYGEIWVAEEAGTVAGFAAIRRIDSEAELLNLAVHPEVRRKGCGSRLVEHLLHEAGRLAVERVFLEVRASNEAAVRFYAAFGFQQIGCRRCYYAASSTGPSEDALVLAKTLPRGSRSASDASQKL